MNEFSKKENILFDLTEEARSSLIPAKSKSLYELQYHKLKNWCFQMKIENVDEQVLLEYFQHLAKTFMPTTLWSTFTKIKAMLMVKENIDISKYIELQCFLKRTHKGHKPKKAKVFTNDEIKTFIRSAPDEKFLVHKVALLIGLHGFLRCNELLNLKAKDVKREGSLYQIHIQESITGEYKTFFTADMNSVIEKYISLRPPNMDRFFVQFRNEKCTRQYIGKMTLSNFPKDVANFLELPNASEYTGYSVRRTSATLMVDQGADLITLKRFGVWKSSTVAENFINESIQSKMNINQLVTSAINQDKVNTTDFSENTYLNLTEKNKKLHLITIGNVKIKDEFVEEEIGLTERNYEQCYSTSESVRIKDEYGEPEIAFIGDHKYSLPIPSTSIKETQTCRQLSAESPSKQKLRSIIKSLRLKCKRLEKSEQLAKHKLKQVLNLCDEILEPKDVNFIKSQLKFSKFKEKKD